MPKSVTEQLADVEQAIADITANGQEVYTRNKRMQRGDLATLFKERARLEELLAEENGYGVEVAVITRRG